MNDQNGKFTLEVQTTDKKCPIGEITGKENLVSFDALSNYKKYTDRFDVDSVPEDERKAVAREVANWVLDELKSG